MMFQNAGMAPKGGGGFIPVREVLRKTVFLCLERNPLVCFISPLSGKSWHHPCRNVSSSQCVESVCIVFQIIIKGQCFSLSLFLVYFLISISFQVRIILIKMFLYTSVNVAQLLQFHKISKFHMFTLLFDF